MPTKAIPFSRLVFRHVLFSLAFVLLYLILNHPSVLMVTRLGFIVWYPAIGLTLAVLLGISPWYLPLTAVADTLSSVFIYHQPLLSWTSLFAPPMGAASYAVAAYLLRGPAKIDPGLRHRSDVVRYVLVTALSAVGATLVGVTALAADHTIPWSQFWQSAAGWFVGDTTGLLGFAPFLLIHVLPSVRSYLAGDAVSAQKPRRRIRVLRVAQMLELAGQILSIPLILWLMFSGPFASKQLFYLAFIPVIWISMRHGIQRVVTALVALNFGIAIALRIFPAPHDVLARAGFLMLVVSATGLIVGSAVTERHRIAKQLSEQTIYLNTLIENNPLGIVVHDRQGVVQLCNDAFEALFLFPRDELVGNPIDSFIVPPESVSQGSHFVSQVSEGHRVNETVRRIRKDGVLIDVELHAVPLLADGEVYGAFAIYKDVTDQIKAAEMLQERSETLSRSVTELQLRNQQLGLLAELSDLLQCSESSAEANAVVAKLGKRLFVQAASGDLFLFKSSRNALEGETQWGDPGSSDATFAPETCWALRKGKPHWSDSVGSQVVCAHIKDVGSSDHLCIPMMARGETLGVFHLRYAPPEAPSTRRNVED